MEMAFAQDDFKACKTYAEIILEHLPDNVNALRGMGVSLFMEEDYENALKYLIKSLKLSTDKEFDYTYIAWCFCNQGKHLKACETFEKAIEINPLYEPALSGRTQAIVHLHGDRLDKIEELEKNLQEKENDF